MRTRYGGPQRKSTMLVWPLIKWSLRPPLEPIRHNSGCYYMVNYRVLFLLLLMTDLWNIKKRP